MPTFQELERAFLNAHKAGDRAAASALAAEIRNSASRAATPVDTQPAPEEDSSDLVRGFTSYLPQTKETVGGAQVLLGKALGSEDIIKSGVERMNAAKAELAVKHKATDSFTTALDKGVGAVLTDWLPYQMGSGAANLVESLAVMFAGSTVGSLVAPGVGTVTGGALGFVEKELVKRGIKEAAEKIAKEQGEQAAKEYFEAETKAVVKDIAKKAAATSALAVQAGVHGAGEVTSRAVEEAERLGKSAADIEMERVLPSALVHGVAEFFGDKIGLGAWKNINDEAKTGLLNLVGSLLKNTAVTGTKETPVELIQAGAERFGAKLSLTNAEAVKEYIDSAAAAYGMSVVPAAGGTARSYAQALAKDDAKRAEEYLKQQEATQLTEKAKEEAAQIGTTAVPDASGVVPATTVQADIQFAQMQPGAIGAAPAPAVTPPAPAATTPAPDVDPTIALAEAKAEPTLPRAKKKDETLEEEYLRYNEMLAAGVDSEGKPLAKQYITSITNKLANSKYDEFRKEAVDVTQPAGVDTTRVEPSTVSPASGVGTTPTGAETSTAAGVVSTGGPATTTAVAKGTQPTTLEGAPSVTTPTETKQAEAQGQKQAATAPVDPEILRAAYNEQVKIAAESGLGFPTWEELSEAERATLEEEVRAERATKGMLPAKSEAKVGFLSPAMAAIIKSRIDQKIDSGEIDLARAHPEVTDLYEEVRQDWGERNGVRTVAWDGLSTDEKAIYLNNIGVSTPSSKNEVYNALDVLTDYREAKAPRGASFYENNREAYNKDMPEWASLHNDEREAFLKAIEPGLGAKTAKPKVTTEQMDAGFKAVAEKYNERTKRRVERQAEVAKAKDAQAQQKIEARKEREAVPVVETGERLPKSVILQLFKGDIKGVLAYLTRNAQGMEAKIEYTSGRKIDEKRQIFRNMQKAASRVLFRNLSRVLNTLTFDSKVIMDESNAVVKQLRREGKLAAYDPKTDTFYFTNDGLDEQTILHEIVHAATIKILYAYKTNPSSLTQEQREAAEHIQKIYEFAKSRLSGKHKFAFENVYEFVSYAMTDTKLQADLANMQARSLGKYSTEKMSFLRSVTSRFGNLWGQLTQALMKMYGLVKAGRTFAPPQNVQDEILKGFNEENQETLGHIGEAKWTWGRKGVITPRPKEARITKEQVAASLSQAGFEANTLVEMSEAFGRILSVPEGGIDIEALPAKKPKQAKPAKQAPAEGKADFDATVAAMPSQSGNVRQAVRKMGWTKTTESLVKWFQNDRAAIKNWQNRMRYTKRLISYAAGFNNIYDQLTLSSGNAFHLFTQYAQSSSDALRQEILAYAKKYNLDTDRALNELGLFTIALHEPERRQTLYLRTVPLAGGDPNNPAPATLINAKGVAVTPDAARNAIFAYLDSHKLDESGAKYLRAQLEKIVNDPANRDSKAPAEKFDINNQAYSAAGYTSEQIEAAKKVYESRKSDVEPIIHNIKKLNKAVLELNRMANYMSAYADNYIMLYGFENYVPFKGKNFNEDKADMFNYDTRKIGGELQEQQHSMDGRITVPDNPVLQVMSDAAQAALRAGRRDVTQAIYNAVKGETLKGKILTFGEGTNKRDYLTFEERNNNDILEKLKGENKVFHYMPDGKIAVIEISDKAEREAIRRNYREVNPLTDWLITKGNLLTGVVGQFHTRYNIAFAPVNFVRDVLTNSFTLGVNLGPKATFQYIGAVASDVVSGNLWKTGNFSKLYANGNVADIEALAKSDKTGYYRDLLEYIETGGKVSYIQGIAPKGQYNELFKGVGGSKILRTKEQVDKYFDMYIDAFELSARVSAYRITKSTEIARLKKEDPTKSDAEIEEAAKVTAAAYAKNLANFEQVGQYGRALGAMFMFFRPSATGAVRALEAIAPLARSVQTAKLSLPEFAEAANIREQLSKGVSAAEKKKLETKLATLDKAIAAFEENYSQQRKNARVMVSALTAMGMVAYAMSWAMGEDDEQGRNKVAIDDMSRWTRYARFFIPGTNTIIQIPWGYGLGAFAAAGAQAAAMFSGNTRLVDSLGNFVTIGLDSFLPLPISRIPPTEKPLPFLIDSMVPSVARPLVEFVINVDALGRQIYNNRQTRFGDAYTGGDNIPELYKDAAIYMFETLGVDISPNTLYFFANNYADGASRILHNANNTRLWLSGKKDFEAKTDLMIFDSFFGRQSNFDAREWQRIADKLDERSKMVRTLQEKAPAKYADYVTKNPYDAYLVDMYNKDTNRTLRSLRAEANNIRAMPGVDPKTRTELLKNIVLQENLEKRRLINAYKIYGVEP
jgi:hypothetical protein